MQLELIAKPAGLTRAEARRNAMQAAQARAKLGQDRAAAAAEFDMPGWIEQAVEALRQFAKGQAGVWSIEQARAVIAPTLPAPAELRVWGRVTTEAKARGYIKSAPRTYIATAASNGSAKPAWRSGVAA